MVGVSVSQYPVSYRIAKSLAQVRSPATRARILCAILVASGMPTAMTGYCLSTGSYQCGDTLVSCKARTEQRHPKQRSRTTECPSRRIVVFPPSLSLPWAAHA